MVTVSDKAKHELFPTCLFGVFVFLQFTVLGLANHAGEGCLSTDQRVYIYYALQVFVILGFLLYSLLSRLCTAFSATKRVRNAVTYGIFAVFFVCVAAMLMAGHDSPGYVAVSMVAVLCVGLVGGAAHLRMSLKTVKGAGVARCMGIGSAAAVVMQYLLQIQWGTSPLLPVFMLAAIAGLLFLLMRLAPSGTDASEMHVTLPETGTDEMHATLPETGAGEIRATPSETAAGESAGQPRTPPRRIAFSILIAAIFILFTCFYNEHIHHLMIQSDYASYTAYSWPRLMLVPGYLLFAVIGDRKGGRYVPIASLCIMLVALLNVVLIGSQEAYWLTMCLFYFSIAAFTSYYLLTFWRLAPGTGNPALWAPFGRMLDSAMVLLTGAINLSALPAPVILGMDIAGVSLVIVLMALGGDFNLTQASREPEKSAPSPEERVRQFAAESGLTDREREVLEALVLTEDKNQQIADSLGISRRQVQMHISRIYEKTGTQTRAGLVMRVGHP